MNTIGKFLLEKCHSSGTKQHFLLPSPTGLPRIYFVGPVCQFGSPAAYILYEILNILVATLTIVWKIQGLYATGPL